MKINKNVITFIISLVFLVVIFYYNLNPSPIHLIVLLGFPILTLIALIKNKNNTATKIGFYTVLINAIITLFILITCQTGQPCGTGFFENFEFVIVFGNIILSETIASIAYLIGILRKKP